MYGAVASRRMHAEMFWALQMNWLMTLMVEGSLFSVQPERAGRKQVAEKRRLGACRNSLPFTEKRYFFTDYYKERLLWKEH